MSKPWCTPLSRARWGTEEDTVTKRADVWSDRQLQAGWEYLLRRSIR